MGEPYSVSVLTASGAASSLLSGDGSKLFVAMRNGTMDVFNVATGQKTATWSVGTQLGGMSLATDGSYLLVTERAPAGGAGVVYRVDTSTGAKTTLTTSGGAFYDVEIVDAATALLGGQASGVRLALDTFTFSAMPTSVPLQGWTVIEQDDRYVLTASPGSSDGPLALYDRVEQRVVATGSSYATFAAGANNTGFNYGIQDISERGGLVAQFIYYQTINLYDLGLRYLRTVNVGGRLDGFTFEPAGDFALAYQIDSGKLARYQVGAWTIDETFDVAGSSWHNNIGYGDQILLAQDGSYIIVRDNADGRVQRIDLSARNGDFVGTAGADALIGGRGNDGYLVNDPGDIITELAGQGRDRVRTTISYTLPTNAEIEVVTPVDPTATVALDLTGNRFANELTGNAGDNRLAGGDGDDMLFGGAGADRLNGGSGADLLYGGADDDLYFVDDAGDRVFEAAGGGDDLVESMVSFSLAGQAIERLTLTGAGAINATGNALRNVLIGNAAANILDGAGGSDRMEGGLGDDEYRIDDAGDVVVETAGGGRDRVVTSISYTLLDEFEDLSSANGDAVLGLRLTGNAVANRIVGDAGANLIAGGDGDDYLAGGAANDMLIGGADNDVLLGEGGDDILAGGAGADRLTGGTGADVFRDTAAGLSGDVITDFARGDTIHFTDRTPAGFSFSLNGGILTYTGGELSLAGLPANALLRAAANGAGGVDLTLAARADNDFNGDGRSDVLWRHANGMLTNWLSTGNGFAGAATVTVDTSWRTVGTGDFDGDGRSDILWRHASGMMTNWFATGTGFAGGATVTVDNSWRIAGTGDFNGDGRSDILWRHASGMVTNWFSTGSGFVGGATVAVSNDWRIAGTGDFNGDGRSDVLWRHASGMVTSWQSTGSGFVGRPTTTVDNDWRIVGTGDFNGDGRSDILWRAGNGTVTPWLAIDNGFAGNAAAVTVGLEWTIAGTGDFNGDGRSDVLWRNANGNVTDWLSTGNGFSGNPALNQVAGLDWAVQQPSSDFLI